MNVLVAISSQGLEGDSYLEDSWELTEQLSSCLLDSWVGKASHGNGGTRRTPALLQGGGRSLLGHCTGLSHSSSESHHCYKLCSPSISVSQDGIKWPAVSGSSPLICQGKKINKHSLAWGGEAIRSSKTNVASFSGGAWVLWHSQRSWTPKCTMFYVSVLSIFLRAK